jgi:hypothetical protein
MMIPLLIGGYSLTFTSAHLWLIVLAFLAAIGFTLYYYRRTNPPLEFPKKLVLGILRGVALAVVLFLIAEPLLVISRTKVEDPTVAILVDNSSSMAENRNSKDEFDNIDKYVADIEAKIPVGTRVVRYAVSDTITADGKIDGSADATALGNALEDLAADQAKSNLQAAVLLSDGVSNFGGNPATSAKSLGIPVYTVGFGSPDPLPDIKIVDVVHNPVGFADREYKIEVRLESRGFDNLKVPVRAKLRGKTLAQQDIGLQGNGRQQSVTIPLMPPGEGTYTLEVSVPAQENEQSSKNNSKQIQVKFRKSRIKILLAANYLSWDFKFMKQVLSAQSDFEVDAYINSPKRIEGTIPFPDNLGALKDYDALILDDFSAGWLTQHKQLFDSYFDRTGTGVFILAGEHYASNRQTDYANQLLPYQIADTPPIIVKQETKFIPTQEGKIHPILQLDEDPSRSADILASLPPFAGHLRTGKVNKGTTVLAALPGATPDQPETPILAAHRYRTGKVVELSAFPFWKLGFLGLGFSATDSTFATIMNNTVLWLVARDDLERVNITPEKPIFVAGETIELDARVLDESYLPVSDAEVEATLTSEQNPADTMVISFQPGRAGTYSATLNYIPPGNYEVRGSVTREGVSLGKPKSSFVVEPYSLEDLSQISDFDMLKRISEVSGGTFVAATDTASLQPFPELSTLAITSKSETALFDYPALLVIFIAAVCVEWYLRRRFQLL